MIGALRAALCNARQELVDGDGEQGRVARRRLHEAFSKQMQRRDRLRDRKMEPIERIGVGCQIGLADITPENGGASFPPPGPAKPLTQRSERARCPELGNAVDRPDIDAEFKRRRGNGSGGEAILLEARLNLFAQFLGKASMVREKLVWHAAVFGQGPEAVGECFDIGARAGKEQVVLAAQDLVRVTRDLG